MKHSQGFQQKQKQVQKQVISQTMRQDLKYLHMNALELQQSLERDLRDNPLAEIEDTVSWSSGPPEQTEDTRGPSLFSHVLKELRLNHPEADPACALYLLSECDAGGYLKKGEAQLAAASGFSAAKVHRTRLAVMDCPPEGICALDLRECLLAQLDRTDPEEETAWRLADSCLELAASGNLKALACQLGVGQKEAVRALGIIRGLDPRPASRFQAEPVTYIRPEIRIDREDGELRIRPMRYFTFRRTSPDTSGMSREEKNWTAQKARELDRVEEGLKKREQTLLAVVTCMVRVQEAFLLDGAPLEILKMQDVAKETGLHVSTISRAAAGKYYLMDGRLHPVSGLFCREVGGVSADWMRRQLMEVLSGPGRRMSDRELSEELARRGLALPRRTVAKYRQQLAVPRAAVRRKGNR